MSQIKDFANDIEEKFNGQFHVVTVIGRTIEMQCDGIADLDGYCDDELRSWKIKIGQKKCEVWNNHLVGLIKKNPTDICDFVVEYCKKKAEKNTDKATNKELGDYLVSLLPPEFIILNKGGTPEQTSFVIDGPNGRYTLKATYKKTTVDIWEEIGEEFNHIQSFDFSNPNVDKSIASYLVEFDKTAGGKHANQHQSNT